MYRRKNDFWCRVFERDELLARWHDALSINVATIARAQPPGGSPPALSQKLVLDGCAAGQPEGFRTLLDPFYVLLEGTGMIAHSYSLHIHRNAIPPHGSAQADTKRAAARGHHAKAALDMHARANMHHRSRTAGPDAEYSWRITRN